MKPIEKTGTQTKRISALLCAAAVFLAGIFCTGCTRQDEVISRSSFYFDTVITVTLYNTDDQSLIDHCFSLAEKYQNLFSTTIKGSDVWKINHSSGKAVETDPETIRLLKTGIQYGKLSEGAFDITIGPLSELWNISEKIEALDSPDNATDASAIPSVEKISALLPHIDYRNVKITGNHVQLADSASQIDLGGIAKGYIADRMKEYLLGQGVSSGIINLGGNVLLLGAKADGSSYRVGVQKPFADSGEAIGTLEVKDKSVVTSGSYERYFTVNGKRYHHILDVSTGYPYDNGLSEVTIISDNSVDGDALSTTCFALGRKKGMELIESLKNTEAVFVDSSLQVYCTSGAGSMYRE